MLRRTDALRGPASLAPCIAAVRADDDPRRAPLHAVVLDVLERSGGIVTGPYADAWRRLLGVLTRSTDHPEYAERAATFCNLIGVVALGTAEDFRTTATLARLLGDERLAALQDEMDLQIPSRQPRPLATAMAQTLLHPRLARQVLERADDPAAVDTAARCRQAALWLLLADVDATAPAPMPESPEDARIIVVKYGIAEWRRVLAIVAQNPWGPEVTRLVELTEAAGLPVAADAVSWCARVYRKRFEEAERLEVATEIRRLVAISGCSQRQFARYVGTSPSRLSTYVNGLVTPSAAMMLRISRAAAALEAQESPAAGGRHT